MKIIVLDGNTLNPGDLSWGPIEQFGDFHVYDRTPNELIVERSDNAEILLTNKVPLLGATIEQLPKLKYIGVLATGYDVVDCAAAARKGVPVSNIPEYGTASVCQMVFAHILHFCNHVAHYSNQVHSGTWSESQDFCFYDKPPIELSGLQLGMVGYGKIGQAVAAVALAFGMNVKVCTRTGRDEVLSHGVSFCSLREVFAESDFVSLHCPLTADTKQMVNRDLLRLMKPTALLINTARGGLIDESALADALRSGKLAGACLDVLGIEPPDAKNPLFNIGTCAITPHISWASLAARTRLIQTAAENIAAFQSGKPKNVVNGVVFQE